MSRRVEIHRTSYGRVRVETWVNDRCTSMSEALSPEAARLQVETMIGPTTEIIDHTQREFRKPGKSGRVKFLSSNRSET